MSIFHTILSQFQKYSLTQNSKLTEPQLSEILNLICRTNTNLPYFDKDIEQQFWEHSNKAPDQKVLIKDYIQTIIDARNILNDNIIKCQRQLQYEDQQDQKEELKHYMVSYKEDLQIISDTFQLQLPTPQNSKINSRINQQTPQHQEQDGQLISGVPSLREQSHILKLVFFMTVIMACLELLCMQARDHFMNILVYMGILCIFFRGYFDRTYMRSMLVILGISIVLDLAWLIVQAPFYLHQSVVSVFSNHQTGFLIAVYILTIVLGIGKIILLFLLKKYRKNDFMTKKAIVVKNHRFQMDGKESNNPITAIIGDSGSSTSSYD